MLDAQNTTDDPTIRLVDAGLHQMVAQSVAAGPLRDLIEAQIAAGGGMVRARITLDAAQAMNLDGVPVAVGVEALHLASLIHDDVCDGASTRRGVPSVCAAHGAGIAIAAGDLLIAAALSKLTGEGPAAIARMHVAKRAVALTVRGQVADIAARGGPLSIPAYLRMAGRKCGPLLGLGPALVLHTAEASDVANHCFRTARWLAIAYQIADDLDDQAEDAVANTPNLARITGPEAAGRLAAAALVRARRCAGRLPKGVDTAFDQAFGHTDLALKQARHAV